MIGKKMNLLIVDSDVEFADHLKNYFNNHFQSFREVEIATEEHQIRSAMQIQIPDFLVVNTNINNEVLNEIFTYISIVNVPFVLISNDSNYALDALKYKALEFVLMPVQSQELNFILKRAVLNLQLNSKVNEHAINHKTKKVVMIWDKEKMLPIEVSEIIKIKSQGSYSCLFLKNNKQMLSTKNLGIYEEMLRYSNFIRIHHSCIVNIEQIKFYNPGANAYVTLNDSKIEYVSKRRKKELLKLFNEH